jgi:hypothetical protein
VGVRGAELCTCPINIVNVNCSFCTEKLRLSLVPIVKTLKSFQLITNADIKATVEGTVDLSEKKVLRPQKITRRMLFLVVFVTFAVMFVFAAETAKKTTSKRQGCWVKLERGEEEKCQSLSGNWMGVLGGLNGEGLGEPGRFAGGF